MPALGRQPYPVHVMKSNLLLSAALAAFVGASVQAGTVPLNVSNNYNFQLAGNGGGAVATLNGVQVEIYCDNFANEINLGQSYTANVTPLSSSADLSKTRFGNVSASSSTTTGTTGWEPIILNDGNTTLDNTDDAFFNTGAGLASLERYEMVAYLVSQYNLANNTTAIKNANNQIQEAIWTLMDPTVEGAVIDPSGLSADSYLEQAASWVQGMNSPGNQSALDAFLAHFEVVSDSTMTFHNHGAASGGFQEQIVDLNPVPPPTPTPEPRDTALALGFLVAVGAVVTKRFRQSPDHVTS